MASGTAAAGGKWKSAVDALIVIALVMFGLYLFDAAPDFTGGFGRLSGCAEEAMERKSAEAPPLDWTMGILFGVMIGGVSGGLITRSWRWVFCFEDEPKSGWRWLKTALFGVPAGFLLMLGSLLAGDVPAGHVAGAMELSPGSWMFLIITFFSAGATGLFLERVREGAPKGGKADKTGGEA